MAATGTDTTIYRFLIDEQLPPVLRRWLHTSGYEAAHVRDIGLIQTPDGSIAARARLDDWIILTKDEDFRDLVASGVVRVVLLGCGNITNAKLLSFLAPRWQQVLVQLDQGVRLIEVR